MRKVLKFGIAGAALTTTAVACSTHTGSTTWTPSPAQLSTALGEAQVEAWTSVKQDRPQTASLNLASSAAWPTTVRSVTYVATTRKAANKLIDGSTAPDNRNVIVAQLVGDFTVQVTGPPGSAPTVTGAQMTISIDPDSGAVLDFGLDPSTSANLVASIHPVFRR